MPTFTSATLDRFLEPGEANKKRNMPTTTIDNNDSSSFSFFPHKDGVVIAPVFSPCNHVVKTYENAAADIDGFPEDFFDPRDSMSVDAEDRTFKLHTPTAEFYDAYEELSEGGSQNSLRDLEAELRERRLSWLIEIEGRKQAEETLDNMKRQWERLAQKLSFEGLTLPSASTIITVDEKLETDPAEGLCQQIRLARAVSTSVGMGAAKAEAEMDLESKIESKNFEIARLLHRLSYYEAVNHEMSLRNQEATDMARRLTQRRKRRQRWIWSAAGASVVLGSVALALFLLPTTSGSPPTDSCHAPEGESATNHHPT